MRDHSLVSAVANPRAPLHLRAATGEVRRRLCLPPMAGWHGGAYPGRLAWKGTSAKLWLSWAMIRSTSAYRWASRAKSWCWGLWRCCSGWEEAGGVRLGWDGTQADHPASPGWRDRLGAAAWWGRSSPCAAPRRLLGSTHSTLSSSWAQCRQRIAGLAPGPWLLWGGYRVGESSHHWSS